mgnify:FL=1
MISILNLDAMRYAKVQTDHYPCFTVDQSILSDAVMAVIKVSPKSRTAAASNSRTSSTAPSSIAC